MSAEVKVSVVIPVYNTEKYLCKCLDSFTEQTLDGIEIICVNDGSSDGSRNILKGYEDRYANIIVIDQENAGAAAARNAGLKRAAGEYILFFDSDDFFDIDGLEKMVETIEREGADICCCELTGFDETGEKQGGYYFASRYLLQETYPVWKKENNPKHEFQYMIYMPCKLYKKSFLMKHHIRFQSLPNANDLSFAMKCAFYANKVVFMKDAFIHYRINNIHSVSYGGRTGKSYGFEALDDVWQTICDCENTDTYRSFYWQVLMELDAFVEKNNMSAAEDVRHFCLEYYEKWGIDRFNDFDDLYCKKCFAYIGKNKTYDLITHEKYFNELLVNVIETGKKGKKGAIWGVGKNGIRLLRVLQEKGIAIDRVIDSNEAHWGEQKENYIVSGFEEVKDKINVIFVSTSKYYYEIQKTVANRNVECINVFPTARYTYGGM